MKFLPLVWRNLLPAEGPHDLHAPVDLRRLRAVRRPDGDPRRRSAWASTWPARERLMVIDKVSLINPLPAQLRAAAQAVDGRQGHHARQLVRRHLPGAEELIRHLRGRSRELAARSIRRVRAAGGSEEGLARRSHRRRSSASTPPSSFGWKVGERVPIQGTIYRRPDGGPVGVHDRRHLRVDREGRRQDQLLLPLRLPATRRFRTRAYGPRSGRLVRVQGRRSRRSPQSRRRRSTRCSPTRRRRRRRTPKRRSSPDLAKQVGDIGQIMVWIARHGAVHHPARLGNTMAQAIRERTNELARAQDARLRRRTDPDAGAARIDASSRFVGGVVGLGLCVVRDLVRRRPDARPAAGVLLARPVTSSSGLALVLTLGLAAGLLPALQASRLKIVDALRRN